MCGIGGASLIPGSPIDLNGFLQNVQIVQNHRGPDGQGIWVSPDRQIGLCHNRLSIIDTSQNGHQPMVSSCGRYIITFNGEIYNYQSLRRDLEQRGFIFKTQSDTEVLLQAYAAWGDDMLGRLRGMYAFSLYDTQNRSMLCARDPIGKKPFIYGVSPNGIFFASEIPALRHAPNLDWSIDHNALASMMLHNMRHIPDPSTVHRGLQRLRPGHAMRIRHGRIEHMWQHWAPHYMEGPKDATHVRECLEESIKLRLQSDVPVGALLSGGIDSTAIVALMQKYTDHPIKTYALGMNTDDEDLKRARYAAKILGTDHQEFYFDPDEQWQIFQNLLTCYGEPIMLLPLIHSYVLSRAIRNDGIKVVLTGNGADELFYGYTGHIRTAKISMLLDALGPFLKPFNRFLPPSIAWANAAPGMRKGKWYKNQAAQTWALYMNDNAHHLQHYAAEEMCHWGPLCLSKNYIDESNFVGLMVENTHSITTIGDLPAMMASVEMRAPFLDREMLSLALSIPWRDKIPHHANSQNLKAILRQAVVDLVPTELMTAPKRGFGMGIQESALLRGPWRKHGDEIFSDPYDADGLFNTQKIKTSWQAFIHSGKNAHQIAKLFAIQCWLRQSR